MSKIKSIIAKEIVDSRGRPTVEVELALSDSRRVVASCPSGASTGKNEALELRDADGLGVAKAIENINKIIGPKLRGKDVTDQKGIDQTMIELDSTENKSKLGANAILPVSMAVCRAGAAAQKLLLYQYIANMAQRPLIHKIPLPMFNLLEGGVHTDKKTRMSIQEFMIVPQKKTMAENLVLCNKVFQNLKENIEKNYGKVLLGFEGGIEAPFIKSEQALFAFKNAIGADDIKIALDCAASEFYENGKYNFEGSELTRQELLEFYEGLVKSFPIISIEDPFDEEAWNGFEEITHYYATVHSSMIIVGDDLTTTNIKRIKEAHNKKACNGVIIKLNQIGTVSETLEAVKMAQSFGWKVVVSHRSGETMDSFIADLAVGVGADFLKAGSPAKEERMVKYQRVIEIERSLGK